MHKSQQRCRKHVFLCLLHRDLESLGNLAVGQKESALNKHSVTFGHVISPKDHTLRNTVVENKGE